MRGAPDHTVKASLARMFFLGGKDGPVLWTCAKYSVKTWYQKKDQRVIQIKFFTKPKWTLRKEDIERIIGGKGMGGG